VQDTVWRATSDEPLEAGQAVEIASVDGATLKVKRG
jgi:membrane protein implicated in regulation of membrane protease activity